MNNASQPFGSARFAESSDLVSAGMFTQRPDSLLVGFWNGRPLWYSGMGGALLVAGARGGKLRDVLGYNVCSGIYAHSMVILDMKGELAAISQDQTPDRKFCIYWNPAGLHDLPRHRINPVDYLRRDNPALVSDTKVFCENMIAASGSTQAAYFEGRAREFLEGIVLTLVRLKGELTLPDLYRIVNLIPGGSDAWLDFAFEMSEAGFPITQRVEEEIAASRSDSSGGFRGILGELFKAFACLSDPTLMESVSPPFDFSMAELTASDQAYQVYLMPPASFVDAWSPVIKALFIAGQVYKARAPSAPPQTWLIDECAQLGAFPMVTKLFSIGAGQGIRPLAVFQSTKQIKALGPDAEMIVTASAQLRSYFAVRDLETASTISRMIGDETLEYRDEHRELRARHARQKALQAFLNGGDPFSAGLDLARESHAQSLPAKRGRPLRAPDQILGLPGDEQILFTDGVPHPILAERKPYYEQAFMAGRYHPNPYHPSGNRVRVKTRWGSRWRKVVVEPVPAPFAHYPQYSNGLWSRIA